MKKHQTLPLLKWFVPSLVAVALVAALPGFSVRAADFAEAQKSADALLAKMTLAEKIGQMTQVDSDALKKNPDDVQKYLLGSVLSGGNSNPADNTPATWRDFVNSFEKSALQTRLKIPLLYGIDAVHGHNNLLGATIFPHNVGMGATHDLKLAERAAHATATEIAGTGMHWAFAPCVAVSQNIRWGRSYESFSSDPTVAAQFGVAQMRGFQSGLAGGFQTLACVKHFAGDGGTQNGVDQGNTVCDEATFRKFYLAPYQEAVKAGARSIMVSYSSWNGQKMHGNKKLLTDVLKGEMGFNGFLVSDWAAIDQLSEDYKKDIETSINAGLDMIMIPNGEGQKNNYRDFITMLTGLVKEGKVPLARIDDAVRRILTVKFQMNLFEHPLGAPEMFDTVGCQEHRNLARECVRESLVVLKKKSGALPLAKDIKHLAIIGKGADDLGMQCGGWTIDWQGECGNITSGTTILQGIKKAVSADTQVIFSADGSGITNADAVIVVIGEKPYAEMKGDRADLQLSADDLALVEKARAIGAPVTTLLLSGRPMILGSALEQSDVFIAAWLPGTEGAGVADVLFGDARPHGKLPRPWPASNAALVDGSDAAKNEKPLFPLGYGLN
jgi:beta-glucosidase